MEQFAELLQIYAGNVWLYGGTFIAVLSLLVFVHEWGHFIVARMCGVRVEVFSIGFGKEIFGWNDRKTGMRWKVSMIPLGGYVKMFGDTDPASSGHTDSVETERGDVRPMNEDEIKGAFYKKPVWQRMAIVFAGPAINFIFAIFVLGTLYFSVGMPAQPPVISAVQVGGAADKAGIQPHDRFIKINDREMRDFADVAHEIGMALGGGLDITVLREGKEVQLKATPEIKTFEDGHGFKGSKGFLGIIGPASGLLLESIIEVGGQAIESGDIETVRGLLIASMERGEEALIRLDRGLDVELLRIAPSLEANAALKDPENSLHNVLMILDSYEDEIVSYSLSEAFVSATKETYKMGSDTLRALGQMVSGERSAAELGGVIRIGAVAGDMANRGIIAIVIFTAMLSINLGIINLFPIPMLDGGHLVFYAAEAVKGTPISEQYQEYAFRFGFVLLIGLMAFANLNDILQLLIL